MFIKVKYNTLNIDENIIFEAFNNFMTIHTSNIDLIHYNSFDELMSDETHDYDDIVFLYLGDFYDEKDEEDEEDKLSISSDISSFSNENYSYLSSYWSTHHESSKLPKLPKKLEMLVIEYSIISNEFTLPDTLKYFMCNVVSINKLPKLNNGLELLLLNNMDLCELSKLPDTIKYLDCSENKLMQLPELPNSLKILDCQMNNIFTLPELPKSLTELHCSDNSLIFIPELPNKLVVFDCVQANIKIIKEFNIYKKIIKKYHYLLKNNKRYSNIKTHPLYQPNDDIINNINILTNNYKKIKQYINNFELPKLSESLKILKCSDNQLKLLPELPNTLEKLECTHNKLTTIPKLPTRLKSLECYNNKLITLPKLPNTLENLNCDCNKLKKLPDSLISCRNLNRCYYYNNEIELTIQQMNFINTIVYGLNKDTKNNIYNNNQNVHNSYIQKCIYDNIQILMSDTE